MTRNLLFLTLAFFSVMAMSCGKNNFGKTTAERLHGTWVYEKAKIRRIASPNTNVIDEYRLSSIRFNSDYTLRYYDAKKDLLSTGEWEIYSYAQTNDDDDTETIRDLYIFILDTASNSYQTRIWKDFEVTNKKLTTTEDINVGDEYKFELKRIEKK